MSRTLPVASSVVLLLFIALSFLTADTCYAVSMGVSLGFDGTARSQDWTPIEVTLSNPGGRQIDGVIHVLQKDAEWATPTCVAKVSLPPNSKKLYHVYLRAREYGDISVVLKSGMSTLAEERLHGNLAEPMDRLVVSIGGKSSRLSFLEGEAVTARPASSAVGAGGPPNGTIHVGSIESSLLPDRPAAYDGVDVLVASDLSPSSVDPKSLKALCMWVASGGTLVVPTGANYKMYTNSFYDELLPVKIAGGVSVGHLKELSGIAAGSPPSGNASLATSTVKPGICTSVEYAGNTPVYARRSYGAGTVIFLAFDPLASPFRDWSGQTAFWKGIVNSAEPKRLAQSGFVEPWSLSSGFPARPSGMPMYGLGYAVANNPAISSPSFNTTGLFMLAYFVALVPVNYFLLKRKGRLELAWVTVPAIVVVFTLGAYVIGYTMKGGRLEMNEASYVEGSTDSRYASQLTCSSVFSPARRTYSMEVSDPFSICRAGEMQERQVQAIPEVYLGESTRIDELRMAMWSSRTFESKSGIDLGGSLKGTLVLRGDRLQGEVENDTTIDISDCRVIFRNGVMEIGDLPKGRRAKVDLQLKPPTRRAPVAVRRGIGRGVGRGIPGGINTNVRYYVNNTTSGSYEPLLVGKMTGYKPSFALTIPNGHVEAACYCVFRLGYQVDGTFLISPSSFEGKVIERDHTNLTFDSTSSREITTIMPGGHCVRSFYLPMPANSIVTSVTASVPKVAKPAAPAGTVSLALYDFQTAKWTTVRSGQTVETAARYVSENSEVRVKVTATGKLPATTGVNIKALGKRK